MPVAERNALSPQLPKVMGHPEGISGVHIDVSWLSLCYSACFGQSPQLCLLGWHSRGQITLCYDLMEAGYGQSCFPNAVINKGRAVHKKDEVRILLWVFLPQGLILLLPQISTQSCYFSSPLSFSGKALNEFRAVILGDRQHFDMISCRLAMAHLFLSSFFLKKWPQWKG